MTAVAAPSEDRLIDRFRMDKSQRASLLSLLLVFSQVAKYVGDGAYFVFFQMQWSAGYPKGNAVYADWYIADWFDRFPVHLQNVLGTHWFATQVPPAWWVTDRHLARGIIIGLVAAALVQSFTVGLKVRPYGPWRLRAGEHEAQIPLSLAASPLLITVIVLPLTALGVYLITEAVPDVSRWGTAASIPYLGDWLAAGNWQPIVLGFAVLWPAKRVIKRVGATLQEASIDNRLLRKQQEKLSWRFTRLPNWLQRFRYMRALELAGEHEPRDHGALIGAVLTVTVFLSVFLLAVGVLVTTVGPAAHAGH